MTLDQQLTELISAARRQIMAHFDERMKSLATEIGQATSSDRTAAIREVRLVAEAEIAKRTQEAVAAVQAESARRLDEAVVAARTDAESLARADADGQIAAAVIVARQEAEETARQTANQALVDAHVAARHSEFAQIDRVVEAVRRFDLARSLTDVLDALGEATSNEAPRVALFLVRGHRLAGWRATGFDPAIDPRTVEIARDELSLLWRAIASGQALSTTDAAAGGHLVTPFGELGPDAAALAVPVRVGGETVAVIYADDAVDGPRVVPSAWPEVVEVLARHAARCLEVLTMSRAVVPVAAAPSGPTSSRVTPPARSAPALRPEDDDSARRYARLLVSEIKLYHEAAVNEGRDSHNLADRLRSEIARARKLYEDRVPEEIRNRADYFDLELVRTLANGDPALLGASRT
jgi:hypothetical protein